MKRVTLNVKTVSYREWGSGRDATVLILHGWGVDSSHYEELGPQLAKKGFHVIVPDLPGWGNTQAPPKAWGVGEYVAWVHDVTSTLKLSNVILFGHSFGGRIAIKYAVNYPQDLQTLILCAAAGIKPPRTMKRIALYCLAKIGRTIFQPPGLSFAGEILKRILYRLAGVTDYLKARGIMKDVLTKAVKEDLKPLLHKINIPTLILWGTEDRATPYKDGQTMARIIPNAKLVTFEGQQHNLPKYIPENLAEEITHFVMQSL